MFRLNRRSSPLPTQATSARQLLRRALLFGGGLVLLWLAVQLMPSPATPEPTPIAAESPDTHDVGVVVSASGTDAPRPFSTGTLVAFLVLAAGGGVAWYLRRRSGVALVHTTPIQSIGQLGLAQNQQLRLVKCGGEVLLLGVTAGQITLLKSYPEDLFLKKQATADAMNGADAEPEALTPGAMEPFGRLLRQQMGPFLNTQATEAPC